MKKACWILSLVLLSTLSVHAQQSTREKIVKEGDEALTGAFEDKFRWGVSLNMYWSTIAGEMVEDSYFLKPSLGGTVRAEYYFLDWLGVGIGAGYQQRGAGIYNIDNTGGAFSHPWITNDYGQVGNLDSTTLERIRFNTLEFPVTILLRSPKGKGMWKGARISGAVGPTLIHNMSTNRTMQSIIDGFHPYNWVTDNYIRNELGLQASVGAEIDSGGGKNILQVHFVYTRGSRNIYANNQGIGYHETYGVRLAWLF